MADHDPMQPVGGSPLAPAAPISPQEIVAHLREAAGAPPGQQSPWEYLIWWFAADTIEALTAENARLTSDLANKAASQAYWRRMTYRCIELSGSGDAMWDASGQDWYAFYRAKVEADFATAKDDEAEGLRPLSPDEIEAGSYLLTRAKAGSIDMALLGDLCRKEPDADTKREVAETMAGIPESPLSHPRYPALVKMVRESSKDGD